jgi:glycosyltransferase involved in cell wall biosynthesis
MKNKKTALLIATYNWPEALNLVLKSLCAQTQMPDEILIADDGSTSETQQLIEKYQTITPIPIKHFWHEDLGFRKTIILNQAISKTNCDYIIQIDGDIVMHPKFVENHIMNAKVGFYTKGSRCLLSDELTKKAISLESINFSALQRGLKNRINATYAPAIATIFRGDKFRSDNLKGCNFAFWRNDCIAVNGYNNDFIGWGHEDIELAARLTNYGIKQRQLKMTAICYHLYHKFNSRVFENPNYQYYLDSVEKHIITCKNGINQSF